MAYNKWNRWICKFFYYGDKYKKISWTLVAALTPPARRSVILSKVDEAIRINGKDIPIYSNIGKDYVTKGYKYLEGFEKNTYQYLLTK